MKNIVSDLVVVCYSCRKRKEPSGEWTPWQEGMAPKNKSKVSHGLCSCCMEKLYGAEPWYKTRFGR